MNDQRFIIEMGSGNDQYGMDYTKAAARAIEDAIRHSSIPMLAARGIPHQDMRVQVTIGVQEPDKLDTEALKAALPRGTTTITATHGGLNVANRNTDSTIVIATAAVEAFLPKQT
ncbi:Lin0512 family protein [Planktotalea sp.]|uniref:Lin0512 family protein n=1 Tax=Planktotalea sp. TaxID=2029877 RepID=UPI0025EC9FAF|nr:Lin0512 family protein [Planktotalea sp.]